MTNTNNLAPQDIKTIGILGGGQLGMMLAQSAIKLGYHCIFLEDAENCPASLYGKVYKSEQLEDFAKVADVFTLEFENTPVTTVEWLKQLAEITNERYGYKHGMFPPPIALEVAQDRLAEKSLFNQLGIATVPFVSVSSEAELQQACVTLGLPIVLKTSRGGYDGKGQVVIRRMDDTAMAWAELGDAVTGEEKMTTIPAPLIAEGFINFSREVSIIAVRSQTANQQINCNHTKNSNAHISAYQLVENHHHNGILAKTLAPATGKGTAHLNQLAKEAVTKIMEHLDYVGVMTLELFICQNEHGDDMILVNEIAPRVHNSGHWSIEGAVSSQFENHIRAVVGLPLGSTDNICPSIMVNILGQYPNLQQILSIEGLHYHTYHKEERSNRKIAHITIMPADDSKLDDSLQQLIAVLPNKMGLR